MVTANTKFKLGFQYTFDADCREAVKERFGFYPPKEVTCIDIRETSIDVVRNGPYLEWAATEVIPTVAFGIPLTRYVQERNTLREFRMNISELFTAARRFREHAETKLAKASERENTSNPKKKVAKKRAVEDLVSLDILGI